MARNLGSKSLGKMKRRKGVLGEQEAAALLRPLFPDVRRRCAGEESQHVHQGADLEGCAPLAVQVKLSGTPRPLTALQEATEAARDGEIPIALVRQSRMGKSGGWVAVLAADELVRLLRRAGYGGGGTVMATPAVDAVEPRAPDR